MNLPIYSHPHQADQNGCATCEAWYWLREIERLYGPKDAQAS